MAKISAAQSHLRLQQLAKKLAAGYTDKEIMQALNLKRRTFYHYKAKVCSMYGNIAEKKTEQVLEFEAQILKDRFMRLYRNLEQR
jgi:ACT domain-containing protein